MSTTNNYGPIDHIEQQGDRYYGGMSPVTLKRLQAWQRQWRGKVSAFERPTALHNPSGGGVIAGVGMAEAVGAIAGRLSRRWDIDLDDASEFARPVVKLVAMPNGHDFRRMAQLAQETQRQLDACLRGIG